MALSPPVNLHKGCCRWLLLLLLLLWLLCTSVPRVDMCVGGGVEQRRRSFIIIIIIAIAVLVGLGSWFCCALRVGGAFCADVVSTGVCAWAVRPL